MLREYSVGEHMTADKVNNLVRAVNKLLAMTGDGIIKINHAPNGITIGISIDQLAARLPRISVGIVPGIITAVTEDNTPPCDHLYKAESIYGRTINVWTLNEQGRDDDVIYNAAAENDSCLMWWDSSGTGHLIAVTESTVSGGLVGNVVGGFITAVQVDSIPPCLHKYKAEALDGREITTFTSPDRPLDDDVLYIAAAENDSCLMWWEVGGGAHLIAITEVYDTIEDV